jgi:hypothetical protein
MIVFPKNCLMMELAQTCMSEKRSNMKYALSAKVYLTSSKISLSYSLVVMSVVQNAEEICTAPVAQLKLRKRSKSWIISF